MTVTSTLSKIVYAANGATTLFTFPFAVINTTDIQVFITDALGNVSQISPALFSVTLNNPVAPDPTPVGGSVTYPQIGAPLATGNLFTIVRTVPVVQNTSLANQGVLYPTVIEQEFDDLVMMVQQLYEIINRQITVAISDPNPLPLPAVSQRKNLWAAFDANGNMIPALTPGSVAISGAMVPVVQAASIAAAQILLGIPVGAAVAPGIEAPFAGLIVPSGWYLETGAAISRAGDAPLLSAIAPTYTGLTILSGNATVTGFSSTEGFCTGMVIESPFFTPGTTILSVGGPTAATMSANATGNGAVIQVFPHGNGNGSTTFNLPDGRAYTYAGRDDMGGTPVSRLTTPTFPKATGVGITGGTQNHSIIAAEMAAHTHTGSGTTSGQSNDHQHFYNQPVNTFSAVFAGGIGVPQPSSTLTSGVTADHSHNYSFTTSTVGSGTAMGLVQPTSIRNWIIKR